MAITYNNLQSAINSTTLSAYVPPSLTDSCLVVIVTSEDVGNNDPITGITFGGVSMVEGVIAHSVVSTNAQDVAIFYLVNPSTSSGNIAVTGSERQSIIAMTLDNVSQSSPIDDTGVREVNTGKDLAVSGVTTNANSFAVSGCVGDNTGNILTLTTGVKIISLGPTSAPSAAAVSTISTAGAYSHNWVCDDNLVRAASAIVAFNLETGGGGISATVTEVLNSFTDTSNINIDYNVSAIITETLNSFGDTSVISVTSGQVVNLTVTETLSAFTDVSNINVSANIELLVTEVLNSFLDGANVTIAKDITLQVTEVFNSFADNSSVRLPANWVDKIKVTTTYTTQTPVSTTWIDKG